MKIKTLIVFALIIVSCQTKQEKKENAKKSIVEQSLDKNADLLLLDSTINAISIGVYHKSKTYIKHYGELDKGKGNKPTDETIYEIASVSKTFAGTLVAQAELEGKLNLEDNIQKYLKKPFPNFEYNGNPIKIKHLITHTSRLPRFLPDIINKIVENPTNDLAFKIHRAENNYSKEKFFSDLALVNLDTIPGTKEGYSSVDTELIAHILENIYGKSYEELIQKKICQKLAMTHTGTVLKENAKHKLANGYLENNVLAPKMISQLWGAGGGMTSTLPDLMKYIKFQLNSKDEVAKKSHQILYQNGNYKIGYYWPIGFDQDLGTYYSHQGGAFGIQNYMFVFPEENLGISVIINQNIKGTSNKLLKVVHGILEDLK
ncbi:MAG TPA: serine hydrolase [Microscillaceae bacterium]|nr:serine hydrolase [Microscillaceae bacterium]